MQKSKFEVQRDVYGLYGKCRRIYYIYLHRVQHEVNDILISKLKTYHWIRIKLCIVSELNTKNRSLLFKKLILVYQKNKKKEIFKI